MVSHEGNKASARLKAADHVEVEKKARCDFETQLRSSSGKGRRQRVMNHPAEKNTTGPKA